MSEYRNNWFREYYRDVSSNNTNNHCVYIHSWSNAPLRYVGSGKIVVGSRGGILYSRPYQFSGRRSKWKEYFEKYGKPEVEIIKEGLTKEEALQLEIQITKDIGLDNLLNKGSGNNNEWKIGSKASEETRNKMSINNSRFWKGKSHTEETRNKIFESHKKTPINAYCKITGELIHSFEGVRLATKVLGIDHGNITQCLRGKRPSAGNYTWRYAE